MNPERPSGLDAVLTLLTRTAGAVKGDRVIGLGAEVAFFTLLSLPPFLLAILGTIGFVGEALGPDTVDALREQIHSSAGTFLTSETREQWLEPTLDELLLGGRADVVSLGAVIALWSSSRAVRVLNDAVALAYNEPDTRSAVRRRIVALGMTLGAVVAVAVLMPLLIAGPRLGEALVRPIGLDEAVAAAWRILYWPVVGVLGIGMLATFYHAAPPRGTRWRRDLPGAVVAAAIWLAGAGALRLYVMWTIQGDTVYGPLATPIAILLWLFLTAVAILVGAELNAEIERLWPDERRPDAPEAPPAPEATLAPEGGAPERPTGDTAR